MAKDDYQVLAIYVLAYLYDCVKHGITPNEDELDEKLFSINQAYYKYILRNLQSEGLVRGLDIINGRNGYQVNSFRRIEITPLGIEKLQDETFYSKAKKALKEMGSFGAMVELL